ncbi:LppC family lipoprotein [Salmonella enterica subsp. enterica serovar Heidelberg str. RI-11-013312]|nr:LppC family lipoprotein [Salmonella enterica subsp. enterica serovar Heidelberg str. RI-11-013312]
MTPDQARTLVINADENVLQGWLDLQRVWFDNRNDPDMLKAGIADWQKRYPQNPGRNAADAARQCTTFQTGFHQTKSLCCCR